MPKAYSPQDKYFHLAKKRGFRARSAFKLEEILQRFPKILKNQANVIDLGAAPGSFLQVLGEQTKGGKICGVDLQKIEPFPRDYPSKLLLLEHDVFSEDLIPLIEEFFKGKKADLITSDLAPRTSGVSDIDQWKSIELNQRVLEVCDRFLYPGGNLIAKIFQGEDFQEFWIEEFKPKFKHTKVFKPSACRDRSFEVFMIGEGFIEK